MKQLKQRYNYDPSQPLSKQYQDAQVFNGYYKCFDSLQNKHYLLSHFKTQNKSQINSLFKKFNTIKSKMQQGINKKYLTQIHDVFLYDKDKSLYLVIDYCEGGSIIDYIGKVHTLESKTAVRIILGALKGLSQLHKYDILNCFINLQNIQIDQNGIPKLSFKCMIYKTIYLSPQFRKQHTKSKQSDLYCLGVCLYRLIYGIFPFKTQKNNQLIQMVTKGPLLSVQKQQGQLFPITTSSHIKQILLSLLNIRPQQRSTSIPKLQQYSKQLTQSSSLSTQIYNKFFKSKYINIFTAIDQNDQHEYSIIDPKQKKILKLLVYNAQNAKINHYAKNVIAKYAKLSTQTFVKIYQYQILQQEYLALVYSYCGEGNLLTFRHNIEQGFSPKLVQHSISFLKKSLKSLQKPYQYLTNQSIYLKNGNLKIIFPPFQTKRLTQLFKKLSSSGQIYFIAPQILNNKQPNNNKQSINKSDSWSIGVIEYWMNYNQLPKLDNKGSLVVNRRQKISKNKIQYYQSLLQTNPITRLNLLNDQQVKSKFKLDQSNISSNNNQIPKLDSNKKSPNVKSSNISSNKPSNSHIQPAQSPIRASNHKLMGLGQQSSQEAKRPQKPKRTKKKDLPPLDKYAVTNSNILPNKIQYDQNDSKQGPPSSKYKSHIIIESKPSLPQKNPNKFDMKMFNQPQQIKTPQKIQTVQKNRNQSQSQSTRIIQQISMYTIKLRNKFALLQKIYTKSVRISIKCLIVIIIYLFLFYFNFFRISGLLIGSRKTYQPKTILIRAFSSDSKPTINYTLVTKTPTQTNQLFYNTTVPVLRDNYKCVLNDYSVKSNVSQIIKSQGFVTYQVFGILIALINILLVCIVIARYDICKACYITNFDQKKYHTLINYGIIILYIVSLTSLHYLIYGGLYHLMLQPCLGKSSLPGLQFLMKNWISSWLLRFVWIYIGIVIAYAIIIFFLINPLKCLNKYVYIAMVALYLAGVGVRGIGKTHSGYQNAFGVSGQLLGLLTGVFLFLTDLMFACFTKSKNPQNNQNNIDTRSIQDFNKTEQFFFGNHEVTDEFKQNQK